MSQYIVSARKYRPSTFATVVGQAALTNTLKNAVATDRLAHAYLFCGSRGVGKTSCARIFAKTINCSNRTPDGEACNQCPSCRAFNENSSLNIVELDAASHNGIDDIKNLIEQVQIPPTHGRYRVFIIDEVHMLSTAAFNAFLKTLEEPPHYVIFILATTEKHKIIPTILSRCQIYDFSRITIPDMITHLQDVAQKENISAEKSALNVIARQADGAMRDALSIFDQVAASSAGNITYQSTIQNLNVLDSSYYTTIIQAFRDKDIPAAINTFHQIRKKGFDAQFFLTGLGQYLRDLMLASSTTTINLIDEPDDVRAAMAQQAAALTPEFLYAAMALCNDADLNYRQSSNKQLLIEITLIRIAQLLNPSPVKSGLGEGLKPLTKKPENSKTTEAPATQQQTIQQPSQQRLAQQPCATERKTHIRKTSSQTTPIKAGSLSINKSPQEEKPKVQIHRERPYTQQMLKDAWLKIAATYTTEPAIANLLEKYIPEITQQGHNLIVVDSSGTQTFIESRLEDILIKMRNELVNDDFNITFAISNTGQPPQFWPDQKVITHMLQNSEFAQFYKALGLALK